MKAVSVCLLLLCFVPAAWAQARVADQPRASSPMELVGEAELKVLFWPIYQSRLYTQDGDYSPEKRPLRFEIQYLRPIKAKDLVARTGIEWQGMGVGGEQHDNWLQSLGKLWPDVDRDDVLTLEVNKQNISTFFLNGVPLGTIEETDFGTEFLDIWLSPDTSRPELRYALTGER